MVTAPAVPQEGAWVLGSAAGLAWGGQEPSLRDFGQGTGDVVAPGGGDGAMRGGGRCRGSPSNLPPSPRGHEVAALRTPPGEANRRR